MQERPKIETFNTTEFAVVSFLLANDIPLVEVKLDNPQTGIVMFRFAHKTECEKLATAQHLGNDKVSHAKSMVAFARTKTYIREAQNAAVGQ